MKKLSRIRRHRLWKDRCGAEYQHFCPRTNNWPQVSSFNYLFCVSVCYQMIYTMLCLVHFLAQRIHYLHFHCYATMSTSTPHIRHRDFKLLPPLPPYASHICVCVCTHTHIHTCGRMQAQSYHGITYPTMTSTTIPTRYGKKDASKVIRPWA